MPQLCVLFAPLLGAIICGFGHRVIGERAALLTSVVLVHVAALIAWGVFINSVSR